jgi:hypothetical protein
MGQPLKCLFQNALQKCTVEKQLIILASAMITFATTFTKALQSTGLGSLLIVLTYLTLFISILLGVRVLFILTNALGGVESDEPIAVPTLIMIPTVRIALPAQYCFFAAGLAFLALFGVWQAL